MCSFLSTSITQTLIGQERYVSLKLIALVLQFTTSQWTSWFYHSPDYFYAFLLREPFSSVRLFFSSTLFVCLLDQSWHSFLLQFVIPIPTFVVHAVRHSPLHSFHSQFVILTVFVIHLLLMVFVYTKSVFRFLLRSYICGSYLILQFVVTSFNICIFILNKAPFVFQSQPVQVKQLLLASIQHNFTNINYY